MFKVDLDKTHNIVLIKIGENFNAEQAEALYADLQQILPQAKKGFKVLTDLSFLEKMDIEAHHPIEKAMELLNQSGVSRIIRVIPHPGKDIGLNIMSLFHYSQDVVIQTCKSLEEAQRYLYEL